MNKFDMRIKKSSSKVVLLITEGRLGGEVLRVKM